jgi:hypothetical protein
MSNNLVNSATTRKFLEQLGHCYRHAGKLYLVGGSSLLLVSAKESTFDIDIKLDIPPEHMAELITCLRQISREMGIPIEKASPDEFLPLPSGAQERHRYIGRFGNLEVFHYDFYSVALAKLHRGSQKDYVDVKKMIQENLIEMDLLETYFQEIFPKITTFNLSANAEAFQRKFANFKKQLGI